VTVKESGLCKVNAFPKKSKVIIRDCLKLVGLIANVSTTPVTPEWRPYSVHTAFEKKTERRGARCANLSNAVQTLWKRCANAVQSPRTPCGGVYFEHAQNKRRGLAFPQRCGVFLSAVDAL